MHIRSRSIAESAIAITHWQSSRPPIRIYGASPLREERKSRGDSARPRSESSLLPLSEVGGKREVALRILPSDPIQMIETLATASAGVSFA